MKWYSSLSKLLWNDDLEDLIELRDQLADRVLELYKSLLIYVMKTVLKNARPVLGILRDQFKLDDWQASLDDIEKAANAVVVKLGVYGLERTNSYLGILVRLNKTKELDSLLQSLWVVDVN